jgi:hypothetical protein
MVGDKGKDKIAYKESIQAARMCMSLMLKDVLKRLPEEMRPITSLTFRVRAS